MSTSPSSSSSSSSSSSAAAEEGDGNEIRGFEGPSSSRPRFSNEIWPEPFIEALAFQVAIDASVSLGRLAAATALTNIFQVCSTWSAVSRSDLLWCNLTRRIWNRTHLVHNTWREAYIYCHQTSLNFRRRRYTHCALHFDPADVIAASAVGAEANDGLMCRCIALSDFHLACGFADGAVRLFDLGTRFHISTFRALVRDRLGRFSAAVVGIVIENNVRLVFATMDGDVHVAMINGTIPLRTAHQGHVVNDGALVDFAGCARYWVGLYAGVPGRAFRIWQNTSEEVLFVGGSLTDPEALIGWHLLTEFTGFVGRVRVTRNNVAVACTGLRVIIFDLSSNGLVLSDQEARRGIVVGSVDATDELYVSVNTNGLARLRRVHNFDEVCRFRVRGASQGGLIGCMNSGYALICAGGVVRVWGAEDGEYFSNLRERLGEVTALVADERHAAAYCSDSTIHLWDFGAQ